MFISLIVVPTLLLGLAHSQQPAASFNLEQQRSDHRKFWNSSVTLLFYSGQIWNSQQQ
jgi:hypothetical protein